MTLTHFLPFAELKIYIGLRKNQNLTTATKTPYCKLAVLHIQLRANTALYFAIFFFNSYIKLYDYKPLLSSLYFPMLGMTKQNVTKES